MTGLLRNNLYTVTQGFTGLFSDESSLLETNPQFFLSHSWVQISLMMIISGFKVEKSQYC